MKTNKALIFYLYAAALSVEKCRAKTADNLAADIEKELKPKTEKKSHKIKIPNIFKKDKEFMKVPKAKKLEKYADLLIRDTNEDLVARGNFSKQWKVSDRFK